MEMPTPCEACDELFDLLDGKESPRRDGVIICVSCAKEQQEEIDYEAEITSLRDQISDAEYTLAHAKARLEELGAPLYGRTIPK